MNAVLAATMWVLGQSAPANLDFAKGSLEGWQGQGFTFTPANARQPAGASSADEQTDSRKGMIRFAFRVPLGASRITFQAYADIRGDNEPDQALNVLLAGVDNRIVPRLVQASNGSWSKSPRILLPALGRPRSYAWDVSGHRGQLMQVVLVDNDERPGHYLWAGDFQISSDASPREVVDDEFSLFMVSLEKTHHLNSMARYDSKRFSAISNASDPFTTERLRNCEVFYDLFLNHFRDKGFAVHAPTQRLMIAVFDSHDGFDAYFGRRMPSGIAGVYHTSTNRLVLYDLAENRAFAARKEMNLKKSNTIGHPLARSKFVETADRKLTDVVKDANLSVTMHECAHLISFNCGLLRRGRDVPAAIAEGLATYCEATNQGDWTSLGQLNPMRLRDLAKSGDSPIPLADLIRSEQWLQSNKVLLGYAQSWALFHMLMHERPKKLRAYLATIADRHTPENRLDDFQAAFGNLATFERQYQAYLLDIAARHRTVPTR